MTWREVIECYELLDDASVTGAKVEEWLAQQGVQNIEVRTIDGDRGSTDFVKATIAGSAGRAAGGSAPTLGIIGRLGGLGARPERIGIVSDGEGALTALTTAAAIARMASRGDQLDGDVMVATHVCPDAPTRPHHPVAFMDSPVNMTVMNSYEVDPAMDAVISVDATKANRICNHVGFAITATVLRGWVLKVSDGLLDLVESVSGRLPAVLPITTQDIVPYDDNVYHVNSIVQPSTATGAPVVGLAITAETAVAGSATGATDLHSVESAVRFCIEAAKEFGRGNCPFYDPAEFEALVSKYGSLEVLQGPPPHLP